VPVRVAIVCPAPRGSRLGNRITALRWQKMLRDLGHRAFIATRGTSRPYDALIALHARKSAEAVRVSREQHPERPIAVALTGTDLYRDIHRDAPAKRSLELADVLVVLHGAAARELSATLRRKVLVVPQSAPAPRISRREARGRFDVAVVAHLRPEKDPLRTAFAARLLPPDSRLRVVHAGRALSAEMRRAALREQRTNPRYVWVGEVTPARARTLIARSRLLSVTSEMEGGANVVSEALAAGTPVVASRIPSMQAILGASYAGLFPFGSTRALARLLDRAERDRAFLARLRRECRARRALVSPRAEKLALGALLALLTTSGRAPAAAETAPAPARRRTPRTTRRDCAR
jgi:putative glycosyltransferase (TIGR04348 family)